MHYDAIIIGSGAGGSAAAYHLTQTGKRVLLLEKGAPLPLDGSTLDTQRVMRQGSFLSDEVWLDGADQRIVPEEHFNLGGKTKWYGAALLRFSPHEFEADDEHQCRAWPIDYDEMVPFYTEAEQLLRVRSFAVEPDFRRVVAGLRGIDARWRQQMLQVGLAPDILEHAVEARHFDAYASVRGLKSDAQTCFLDPVRSRTNLQVLTGKSVSALLPAPNNLTRIGGVECEDGTRYHAGQVFLAAGALHSPRLLQGYGAATGLARRLPAYAHIGRNYKSHVLTALLAFSHRTVTDVLSKTMLLLHEQFPHSTVQTLGGSLALDIVQTQAPRFVPTALSAMLGRRAFGFFLQTEDGSHPDNRVQAASARSARPRLDQDFARTPGAMSEHRALVRVLRQQLLRLGYLGISKSIPVTGTAHACGTLIAGRDARNSVVDANGRVHGMENLFVVDGSVLPRSSRVNPALTIYAWGLRVASLAYTRASSREALVVA